MAKKSMWKISCRLFGAKFLDMLTARELRDIVYEFIVGDPGCIRVLPPNHPDLVGSRSIYGPHQVSLLPMQRDKPTPYYFDSDLIGTQFATELHEVFYNRATFDVTQAYDMHTLLNSGVFFHCPIIVPLNFLRRLEVNLSCRLHPYDRFYRQEDGGIYEEACAEKEDFVRQVEYLSGLTQIKQAIRLILHIKVDVHRPQTLANFEEALVPLIYELKAQGVKLTATRTLRGVSGSVDFTSSYDILSKDWDEKIRKKSAFVSTTLHNIKTAF
jgi:hypothetical protein